MSRSDKTCPLDQSQTPPAMGEFLFVADYDWGRGML